MMKNACASIIVLAVLADPALALDCATSADTAALKTAAIQQELMVAALQCRASGAYNRFVITYRGELQASDATLKSFFARSGGKQGEAGYDTFKTRAANLSALAQARDARAFCADAHALLAAAAAHKGSLRSFVEKHSATIDTGAMCVESRPAAVEARTDAVPAPLPAPVRVAQAGAADVAVGVPGYGRPAIPRRPQTPPPAPAMTDLAVDVPSYSRPAMPYRAEGAAPFPSQPMQRADIGEAMRPVDEPSPPDPAIAEDEPPPAPPPRNYRWRSRDYQYGYYPSPAYPPARGWRPRPDYYPAPSYGWYPRSDYSYAR